MNFLDRTISFFSPKAALNRVANRVKLNFIDKQNRRFEGAAEGRRHDGWKGRGNPSFNQTINEDLQNLVSRSRILSLNNPYARRVPNTIANSVVGTGIIPSPILTKLSNTGKETAYVNDADLKKVKDAWIEWAEKLTCDYDGDFNFYGLQWLAMKTVIMSGEILAIRKRVKSDVNRFGIQIKLLEGDYIDRTKHTFYKPGQPYDYYGIRFDSNLKRIGYWIYDCHPSEGHATSSFVQIEDIIHVLDVERVGQTRGFPAAAATILKQRDLDDYEDAELLGKKTAACMPIFVTNGDPEGSAGASGQSDIEYIEPGLVNYLQPGETVTFATPPASTGFSDFVKTQQRAIANGYGVTYEQFTGDLSNVNFSSARMGWLESQRQVDSWQYLMLIPKFCDKAFKWFADAVKIADSFAPDIVIRATWTAPRRLMIDPVKETNAKRAAMRAGLQSFSETVRQDGYNPEDVINEMKADQEKFIAAGLMPDWTPFFEYLAQQKNQKKDPPGDLKKD